ncbi:MAG: hypothetical protein DMF91_23940 [Acidobacteria bacterium]|nr:MAG: hypothetical protein DMF91_23940 [Acidobacteriota bacterium]
MMKIWHAVAYVNLGVLAADHFVTSVAGLFVPERAAALYQRMFGARLPLTPEMVVVLKPWSALGIFAAIAGVLPILDPERYRGVLYALIVLLGLRVYIRLAHAGAADALFAISRRRNSFHVYLIVQAAAIIAAQLIWW